MCSIVGFVVKITNGPLYCLGKRFNDLMGWCLFTDPGDNDGKDLFLKLEKAVPL